MDAIIKNDKLRRTACYDDVIVMLRIIANKNYRS